MNISWREKKNLKKRFLLRKDGKRVLKISILEQMIFLEKGNFEKKLLKKKFLSRYLFWKRQLKIRFFLVWIVICSKSATQEIVYLLTVILDEACDSSDDHALKLFYTTRNFFLEMYAGLVPLVHKSYLETILHRVRKFTNKKNLFLRRGHWFIII